MVRLARRTDTGSKTDEQLAAEIAGLREGRRAFAREHGLPFREDALGRLDRLQAHARARMEKILAGLGPDDPRHPAAPELVHCHVLASEGFGASAREMIERAGGFNRLTRAEYAERLADFDERIATAERELRRREIERRRDAAEEELAGL
jgi:hypothetical protein